MKRRFAALVALTALLFGCTACSTSSSAEVSEGQQAAADQSESSASTKSEEASAKEQTEGDKAESETSASADESSETPLGIADAARPFDGIITAGQPTKSQFAKLDEAGVNTVINLRGPDEPGTWNEEKAAKEMGLEYVSIPITSAEDLTRDKVDLFSDVVRKEKGDHLVHCGSSNRVGAMFALRAFWILEKSPEEAMAIGEKAGLDSLEEAVRAKMEQER